MPRVHREHVGLGEVAGVGERQCELGQVRGQQRGQDVGAVAGGAPIGRCKNASCRSGRGGPRPGPSARRSPPRKRRAAPTQPQRLVLEGLQLDVARVRVRFR